MRLVVAAPLYPPDIGGPATYAKILSDGLPAKGVEVEVIKFSTVRHLPKIIRHYAYYRRVLRAARTADVVIALDPVSVGLPALKAAKRAGKPFVVKIVGDYAWEQGRQRFGLTTTLDEFVNAPQDNFFVQKLQKIQTSVALAAAKIIVPSEYLKRIVTTWGVPSDKITVIYNAVPSEDLGMVPSAVALLPRPLIVTAGRLVPWKHMDGIIDAVAALRIRGVRASLVIAGDGPDLETLEKLARERLQNNFVFTGALVHADMLATMQSADMFVLNSSYEGLSHFLIEAQTLGTPTVATCVGGNPEVVTDQEGGLLIPLNNEPALTEALARLLSDSALRAQLSIGAKQSSLRFSEETMLAQTQKLLTQPL
jgi:glycosyltransferase involved in cell wall biosynthesis